MVKEGREQKQFIANILALLVVAVTFSALGESRGYLAVSGRAVSPQEAFTVRGFDNQHTEEWSRVSSRISSNYNAGSFTTGVIILRGNGSIIIKTVDGKILSAPNIFAFSVGDEVKVQYTHDIITNEFKVISLEPAP
jgi:hypothetical protein